MATHDVTFWFDFGSPYAYFAHRRLPAFEKATGAHVISKPFMLGSAFAQTGARPLLDIPLKAAYAKIDLARLARFYDVPFQMPPNAPTVTLAAARIFYGLNATDPAAATTFAKAVFDAAFATGQDVSEQAVVKACLRESGLDEELAAMAQEPEWKQALKDAGAKATESGVFGAPFFVHDGEPFWGVERMDMLIAKLGPVS
ncbi:MAG: 2-hydroxychromene-2-carboxylate isomerase [Pseudomonadota bacterium]